MTMTPLHFLIIALASHRLTRLIVADEIFDTPRIALDTRLHAHPHFRYLIGCFWCVGLYISAALIAILATTYISIPLPILTTFAVSSVVGIVGHLTKE